MVDFVRCFLLHVVGLCMHRFSLDEGEDFELEGEHEVSNIEFRQLSRREWEITVAKGDGPEDWIFVTLLDSAREEFSDLLDSGVSVEEVEEFLEENEFDVGEDLTVF